MSSISSKSSSKLQSKSSASGKSSTSGQSGTTTAPRLQSSTATTGGRVPRSSSAATASTSTPGATSALTNGASRPGTAKSSTSGVRRVSGNDVTSAGSEIVDAGRSRNGSQNRQVITAEIHETAVSRSGRPLQSSTSGMEGRSSAVGCRQGLSGTSSTAMTADSGVPGSTRQRFQSLTAATVQVQSHIDSTCSSVVDAMSQTPRTEEELEKMRILARHVKIYTDWANHYLEKVDSKCFITDLQSDISTGVVLSDLVFAVVSEPVPNINRAPQNTSQMISNIEKCLTFLVERGASVDGIEAKNIRAGSLKSILGLLFNLSNYKHHLYQQSVQQQQQQQQKQSRPTKLSSSGACVPTVLAVQSQTHPSGSPVLEHSRRQLPPLPVVSSGSVDRVPRGSSDGCHQGAAAVSRDSSPLKPSPRTPPSEERVKNQNETSSLPERDQPKQQKNFTECGANTNQYVSPLSPCAIDSKKKQTVKSSSAVAGGKKTSPVIDSGGDVNTTASKSSSMLTKFRLFKDRSTDGKTRGKDESLVRVPPVVPEPETVDRSRVTSPSGSQQRRQQLPQPTPRSSSRRDQAPVGYDVSQPGSPAALDGRQTIVANGSSVPGYCSPQLATSGNHGQYSQVPVVAAHQYYSTQPGQQYYGQGIHGYQQQQQQQHYQPATGQMVSSPQSPQRILNYSGLPSSVAHSQQSRLPSSHHNGHVTSPQGAPDHATFVQGRGVMQQNAVSGTSLQTDAHQHVAQSPGNGPQLYNSQQQQQLPRQSGPPSSAPSSRRNNEHPQSQADRRRHGDESAPIKTSTSMPSRTASSTSISSIASTSTACGGGGSAAGTSSGTARKSGLARRVSSASSGQQQSDSTASNTSSSKRSAKSAVGATSGSSSSSSSRIRSGKTSSTSSSAAASGNVTTRPPHVASSDSNGIGTYGRQNNKSKNIKDEELRPNSDPVEDLKSPNGGPSSLKSPGSRIGLPVGRSDSSRSSSASRALPSGVGSLSRNMNRSTEASPSEGPSTAARSTSAGGGGSPGDQSSESLQSKYVADESGSGATSRGPAPSTSRLPSKLSQPSSAKSSRSAVEQLQQLQQQNGASGLPQVRSLTSPPAECLLMKPLRDKSSGSVSSGFGDESNHSTSDSTDSVIYQPPCSPGHLPSSPRSTTSTIGGNERHQLTAGIENSSSSAVERVTAEQTSENNGGSFKSPSTSSGSVHSTAAAVIDHIASLRTGSRPTGAASRSPSTTPTTAEIAATNSSRQTNSSGTSSATGCSRESPSTKQDQTDNAFEVQPMQPIVRSSVAMGVVPPSCTVYQPPTARRLPTLLAAQSTSGSSAIPSGPSASRRLTFGRPLIGPSSRYPMNTASSSRIASGTISSSSTSASASGYTSDGDVLHRSSIGGPSSWRRDVNGYGKMHPDQNGGCVPGYGNGYQDRSSGYMSEGGGASVTYARRMQQRFLEGILAVRQSMERSAHFTDDDSFDECSSLSSDELAPPGDDDLLDESQVDAILENASSSDGSNGNSSPPNNGVDSAAVHQTCPRSAAAASASRSASNGLVPPLSAASAMRPPIPQQQQNHAPTGNNGSVRTSGGEVDRILGNGWRKYYIDSPSGMPPSNANDRRSGSGLVGPFERGSSQRVTLPLAGGGATVAPGALLVKRSQQSVVTDLRSSSSSSARCRDDGEPSAADGMETSRRRSGGHDNNGVDSSTTTHLGHQRQSGMMASRPNSSSDEQRGERISNYSRGAALMHRQGNEMMTHPDMVNDGDWNQTVGDVDSGAGEQFCDDLRSAHPSRSCSVDGGGARRSSFASGSVGAGSVVHKDGGQGPAPQPFYTSGSSIAGYHDYVNINYVGTSRSLGRNGNNRINHNGMNIQQWARNGGSSGMGQRFPGGRMAMSETESIENIAAAAAAAAGWPPSGRSIAGGGAQRNGRELVQRSDSCRSSSNDNEKQSTSGSLPRCGSAVQVWRTDPSNAMAAALRLQAGYGYCGGGTPGRTSASSGYSTPLMSGGKSRLSASSKDDNLHCSTLSLGSNSSAYSTAEEQQAQEIRRLRHELETAQSKISTLSTQLCTNAHVVSAFEQSLANMTYRLQHLAANTDQKEAELSDLRRIIDMLRQQGNIQFNLTSHGPTLNTSTPNKDSIGGSNNCSNSAGNEAQQIRRHVSSDSVVSMCSAGSQQSAATDTSAEKKKKQKTWLKIPFGKAFSRNKKTKTTGSTSDADSDTTSLYSDISVAQSAHAQLLGGGVSLSVPSTPIKLSRSDAVCLSGLSPVPDQSVHDLQQQLHEKDMKLTDIRLEALSSAHQLEQLRDTMNRMKNEMMSLKLDNDRLQQLIEQKGISTDSVLNSHRHSGPPQPHHPNTENRLSLDDPTNLDLLLADSGSRDSQRITLSIRLSPTSSDSKLIETSPIHLIEVLVGIISITGQTTWNQLADIVRKGFQDYLVHLDPGTSLGLSGSSIGCLSIGDVTYSPEVSVPELLPCGYLVGDSTNISVSLKGAAEQSVDSLAFETLIPKTIVQRYVSLLVEHRRIILCGPSGTGKTFLAQRLAEYLVLRAGESLGPKAISTFSVDHKSGRELRQYLSSVADQCEQRSPELPIVIILDSLHHVTSLSEVFNGFLSVDYQSSPYIIGTMNQTSSTCSPTNLQLHHNFRWVLCANHVEPVLGFLARYLRRRVVDATVQRNQSNRRHGDDDTSDRMERVVDWIPRVWQHLNKFLETHSSTEVTFGPRLFLSCPMDVDAVQGWFNDLWNYSIVPYLLEAIKEGVQSYGSRGPWEDPSDWVIKTYPWANPSTSGDSTDWPPLLRLRPEDVGHDSNQTVSTSSSAKVTPPAAPNDSETNDPLLNMLMRLQEAASYTNSPGSSSGNEAGIDSSEISSLSGIQ